MMYNVYNIRTWIAFGIVLLALTFTACQQESVYEGPCRVRFMASVQNKVNVTRADDGYTDITASAYPNFSAGIFVSYGSTAQEYSLKWRNNVLSADLWLEIHADPYMLYGYAPQSLTAQFDKANNKLTISDIAGLGAEDILIMKPCSVTVNSGDKSKTVALQMDHLMAKVTPCFSLNEEYAKIRDIRIKKVEFTLSDATTYTAIISYNGNSYQTSWQAGNAIAKTVTLFEDASTVTNLGTSSMEYGGCCICPQQSVSNLLMKVSYEVYDKQGGKVREGVVENSIKNLLSTLIAGTNYKLNIQIIPTYLYVLSDNDEKSVLVINE